MSRLFAPLSRAGTALAELAWPRACHACCTGIDARGVVICAACQDEISRRVAEPYCRTCGDDAGPHLLIDHRCGPCRRKLASRIRFSGFVRVGPYAGALRRLVLAFKRAIVLEQILAMHMAAALRGALADGLPRPDVLIPVPSHWWRRWQRGHQPTQLLASHVARDLGIETTPALFVRRYIPPLHHGMSRRDRLAALNNVFGVRRGVQFAGQTVGLLDDVMTTGATLSEARRALKKCGARRVCAIVLARATSRNAGLPDELAACAQTQNQPAGVLPAAPRGVDHTPGAA